MKTCIASIVFSLLGFLVISCGSNVSATTEPNPAPVGGNQRNSTPEYIAVSFGFNQMNTILPSDVLQEVVYYGSGGSLDCDGVYTEPTIFSDPIDTELMLENQFVTCHWQAGETLTGKIVYSNGTIHNVSLVQDDRGVAKLIFTPSLSDPEGIYIFQISNGNLTLESNAYFRTPVNPRVYGLSETQLLLHNFASGEKIRLFVYDCKDRVGSNCQLFEFKGWEEYKNRK